ncbi:serine phosphatase RsbU (regulator of sigma subunit) [Roseimicrobium gellanilyticum]|uniref:Serine phosphatase RsbU (Regulator of sigma subunit) n=1 Tax=Roseimicrobium gellanilyticum TaxID=748857 RepID=A0A366HRR5_9BACT|nr:PP2C family protein-serine/threonine phosphatase [Roseimicrobium gellanilyticum]RBP46370.1 serine phosphatase RsbU (regulator of sigma subunit) [Roseimicrobium gellanilyticum]
MAGTDASSSSDESGLGTRVPALPRLYFRIAFAGALFTVTLSFLTLAAWMGGWPLLASVRARYIPMAPSTALCFALLGGSLMVRLFASRQGLRVVSVVAAALVSCIAVMKVIEFSTGWRFGLEELLVRSPEMFGSVPTGRMSPVTAGNFLLGGVALLLATLRPGTWAAGITAFGMTLVSLVVLLGYWYGTPLLYGGTIIPVALTTATAFLCFGIALLASLGPEGWPLNQLVGSSTRALLLRSFLPMTVAAVLIDGAVRNWVLTNYHVNPVLLSALAALSVAVLLGYVIARVAALVGGRLDRAEVERNQAQEELCALNEQLEVRVIKRTQELREKNEQMEQELNMARELQLAMLPQKFPRVPPDCAKGESALKFFSFYFPTGGVSGDYFDVMPISDNAVGIFICDVMGHGVRAALVTAMMRALVGEEISRARDPGDLLARINRAMIGSLKQTGSTMFATAFYLVADVERGEVLYANAGHPQPLRLNRRTRRVHSMGNGNGHAGRALGLFEDATYETRREDISAGDFFMLFTDGLFEVENPSGDLFSHERLAEVVEHRSHESPHDLLHRVLGDVRDFSQHAEFDDDVCLIGMEVRRAG